MSDPLLSLGFGGDSGAASRLTGFDAVEAMRVWGLEWGPRLRDEIAAESPVGDEYDAHAGDLRDSIEFAGVEPSGTGVSMSWTSDVDYAKYVITGTEEHEIWARVAGTLHWFDKSGEHFRRHVYHPGTAPDEFPLRALQRLLPEMNASFAELFEEI